MNTVYRIPCNISDIVASADSQQEKSVSAAEMDMETAAAIHQQWKQRKIVAVTLKEGVFM